MHDYEFNNSRYKIKLYLDKSFNSNNEWIINKPKRLISFEIRGIKTNKLITDGYITRIGIMFLLDKSYTLCLKVSKFLKDNFNIIV